MRLTNSGGTVLHQLRLRLVLSLTLALTLTITPLTGQQTPSDSTFTIRANTRLVTVDVVVTDRKGQPITGLKAEDFTLEENGKKQSIATFTPPATNAAAQPLPPGLISNRPEFLRPSGTPTVLLLDAANASFKDQAYGRWQMLKYISEQSESGIPMAVMTLTDRVHVLQDFTSDPKVLADAIKALQPQIQEGLPMGMTTSAVPSSSIAQAQIASFRDFVFGYNLELRTNITVQAMRDLSRILAGLPGRKNVVWLTATLPFDLIPEDRNVSNEELRDELPGQGRQRSVAVNSRGNYAAEAREAHGEEIKLAESSLASADIAIYPVDMRGIMVSGIDIAGSGTMEEVAAETGGKAYTNQNEIKFGIALAAADAKASYSLGYYPENKSWDGKYRHIKVKLDKTDTQIRYRKGYYAFEPIEPKDHNPEQDVAAALVLNAPETQVSFRAQAKPTAPGKVQVVFLVDANTLTAEDSEGSKKMNVSLYAALYNSAGKNLAIRSIKVDKAFDAATYQQILAKGMMVPIDMDAPAGADQVRLAVLDGKTGFIGTATGPLGQ
jgi:VWFA-related protein